ncbi:MAG: class I SAM-dependent methyltransferase [Solirubrobacteraceae bacterium]
MPCDLCGAADPRPLLDSPRLDGPLVRCRRCRLVYVGRRRADFTFAATDAGRSRALAGRVAELGLVRQGIEEAERPLRIEADRERLARLRGHAARGRLLDVGCATGTFLQVAGEAFDAAGVEPDPGTSEQARAAGHSVRTGTVDDVAGPAGGFDAVTLFHVIEHLDSPQRTLWRVHELLRPGGVVMIETPTVDCVWFRLAPGRWRQLIPDHYYFFSAATLAALLRRCELEPIEQRKVGRRVSLRFLADRMRRSGVPFSGGLTSVLRAMRIEERTVRLNPGDIMSVVARRRG